MAFQLTARMEVGHQSCFPRAEALGGGCTAGVTPSRVKKKAWGGTSPGRISTESGGRGEKCASSTSCQAGTMKPVTEDARLLNAKAAACVEGLRQSAGSALLYTASAFWALHRHFPG